MGKRMTKAARFLFFVPLLIAACGAPQNSNSSRDSAIVAELMASTEQVSPMSPPSKRHGPLTVAEAYAIQSRYAAQRGDIAGYKVAFASKPSQEVWGVDAPVYGPLFQSQRIEDGGTVEQTNFIQFGIELEVAFVLGRPITDAVKSVEELKTYVKSVHLAFDIPDNRFDEKPVAADIIATGAGAHRFLLGPAHDASQTDVEQLDLTITHDQQKIYEGSTNGLAGGPWGCLLFAVNHLVGRKIALVEDTVFLSGAVDKAFRARGEAARGLYVGDGGSLGTIRVLTQ